MKGFQVPSGADQLGREPIEELGMRRRLSLDAEVLGRFDEARAEMVLPDPVDGDARCQWIFRRSQPTGQAQSITRDTVGQRR